MKNSSTRVMGRCFLSHSVKELMFKDKIDHFMEDTTTNAVHFVNFATDSLEDIIYYHI